MERERRQEGHCSLQDGFVIDLVALEWTILLVQRSNSLEIECVSRGEGDDQGDHEENREGCLNLKGKVWQKLLPITGCSSLPACPREVRMRKRLAKQGLEVSGEASGTQLSFHTSNSDIPRRGRSLWAASKCPWLFIVGHSGHDFSSSWIFGNSHPQIFSQCEMDCCISRA